MWKYLYNNGLKSHPWRKITFLAIAKSLTCISFPNLLNALPNYGSLGSVPILLQIHFSTLSSLLTPNIILPKLYFLSFLDNLDTAVGSQHDFCPCLLDLSDAFDTTDHNILLHRLSSWFDISGTALNWFRSYTYHLDRFPFFVMVFFFFSRSVYGVPQGSVLGPILFTLYTTPLSHLISSLNADHHLNADDTQRFLSFIPSAFQRATNHLESAFQEVSNWMSAKLLTLNPAKTEFLLIGLPQQLAKISQP